MSYVASVSLLPIPTKHHDDRLMNNTDQMRLKLTLVILGFPSEATLDPIKTRLMPAFPPYNMSYMKFQPKTDA
jgi:hypothetical protein